MPTIRAVRSIRALVGLAVTTLLVAHVGVASAATYNGAIVGLGTGESSSPSSGFGNLDIGQCVVGNVPVSQTETTYYRCTLEYDIDAVPDDAVVTSAVLNIYSDSMTPCAGSACGMVVSGYVGNAATTLSDLTAGSPIRTEAMGMGSYSAFNVTNFVKSVHTGPDYPVAGFNLAGDAQNPAGGWTVVGHPAGAHPPTLVVTYAIPTQVTVAVAQAATGEVVAETGSIDCPGTCTGTYLPGATLKLHANPSNGFAFSQWVGQPCAGQGALCSFAVPGTAVSVTAVFVSTAPPSTDPPTGPTQPAKTRAPVVTAAPGQPTEVPVTEAPSAAAPTTVAVPTSAPTKPAPTIVGIDDPNAPAAADGGIPGVLIFLIVAVIAAIAIGFGVYKYTASRAPTP